MGDRLASKRDDRIQRPSDFIELTREKTMTRPATALLAGILAATALPVFAQAPTPSPPLFSTTKVDGTDGVYIFRYQGHQAMFVVTPDGVIATDPIGERRPAAAAYIAEIRKITQAPIKYVVYSHSHSDHIAGGKPFKDLGAVFVAHKNTKSLLESRKAPDIVIPDLVVDDGGAKLQLAAAVINHEVRNDDIRRLAALQERLRVLVGDEDSAQILERLAARDVVGVAVAVYDVLDRRLSDLADFCDVGRRGRPPLPDRVGSDHAVGRDHEHRLVTLV